MLLIFGTLSILGIVGVPIFVLLLFFGLPLLQLAPEMLNGFYTKWVTPWLPMRMLYDGVKNYNYSLIKDYGMKLLKN